MIEQPPNSPAKPPPLVFAAVVIALAALCWLLSSCAGIPVKRTYSITYGDAKASITLEPASK